jgi:serine/threonine protein kinase
MGAVYEAEQLSTRKRRALKVLTNRFGDDEKAQERFVREATVGADIRSDHVVDVIGAGIDEDTGLPWLAMELLDGMDLKRLADARGPLEAAHVRTVFAQLGHGLAAAHVAGVVHRDLKPENVFVAHSRQAGAPFVVKILDFGISKVTHEAVVSTDTATIGSPMWMAPEQINAEPVSTRTDVWALGLLGFWAVTGRVYWKAAYGARVTVQALFAEQLFADLVPPSVRAGEYGVGERVPPGFDDWFALCVHRDPAERFTDASAATAALLAVLEPWALGLGAASRALLPEAGAPADASVARSEPVLSPGAGARLSDMAEMAGTTAEALSLQSGQATIAGTSNHLSPSTSMQPAPPSVPSSVADTGAGEEPPPAAGSSGKLVAAVALPVLLLAGAGTYALWPDSPDAPPQVVQSEVVEPEVPDPEVVELDVGTEPERPPREVDPTPGQGRADLSLLPVPSSVEFLGWTAEGDAAAVRVAYGSKLAARGFANYLELIVELDGRTGAVAHTYVAERIANASQSQDDPLARAAAASLPEQRWLERRLALLLRAPEARRVPSRRRGELSLSFVEVPAGSKVRVQAKRTGFDLAWWNFDALSAGDPPPALDLSWTESGRQHPLVRAPVEVSVETLRRLASRPRSDVTLDGSVRVFWSPDETRALVTITFDAARGEVSDRRWFVVEPPAARPRIRG